MTQKLEKYLERPLVEPNSDRKQRKLAIVLADSKGNCIQKQLNFFKLEYNVKIKWWCKGGASTDTQYVYLSNNINDVLEQYDAVVIYLWTGTCDITEKVRNLTTYGKYLKTNRIRLQNEDVEQATSTVIDKYQTVIDYCATLSKVTLVILETPFYSIQKWNEFYGGTEKEDYMRQDKLLTQIIIKLNNKVRDLNKAISTIQSPKFASDVVKNRKSGGGGGGGGGERSTTHIEPYFIQ